MRYSISMSDWARQPPEPPLAEDETDIAKWMRAPLYESAPLQIRRLLAAEKRIAELERKLEGR